MALGPILIFDKSTLQSLNPDEAVLLDSFFLTNITPLFFIETLADLEKEIRFGRTPEQAVGSISYKTPIMGSYPNVFHATIFVGELLGQPVEMRGVPVIGGGIRLTTGDKKGILHKQSREAEAFERWQKGAFLDIERQTARVWRRLLSGLDLETAYKNFQSLFNGQRKPKTLAEVKELIDSFIDDPSQKENVFLFALDMLGVSEVLQERIKHRWKESGQPALRDFAPYATHVFSVDLFFYVSIAADLISRARPSNKIDIAYLYYLPFCMVFASNDNLHMQTVPFFLRKDQTFLKGIDLKEDLKRLDAHYSSLSEEVKAQGLLKFASRPPLETSFLITRLWDKYLSAWRENIQDEDKPINKEIEEAIIKEIREFEKNAKPLSPSVDLDAETADHVGFERRVPTRKGKWRIFSPEVEKSLLSSKDPDSSDNSTS